MKLVSREFLKITWVVPLSCGYFQFTLSLNEGRVVFSSFTRQRSYKVLSDPCRDTFTSLHFSSLKLILLHSFVAHCTRASYPCTPIHVYLQSSSKHKFYTGWLLHSLVAQYSSSVGATPPNPPGMVFSRQAPQL